MKTQRYICLIISCLLMTGCINTKPHAEIQADQFSSVYTVMGSSSFDNPFGGITKEWKIRSWVNKEEPHFVRHQLYVELDYLGDWKHFTFAADETTKSVPVDRIDERVGDCTGMCSLTEIFGIPISDATLRKRVTTGFRIKVYAKDGESIILPITAAMIQVQIDAVDKAIKASGENK